MSGELSSLKAPRGATKAGKHKGRGRASGMGKTSSRGQKGQKARKSGGVRPGFEGGQMPLARRLPKRGFVNIFAKSFAEINVWHLNEYFQDGDTVDQAALRTHGLAKGRNDGIKILANGDLTRKLTVRTNRISKAAKAKIEAAGGTVEMIADRVKWERQDTRVKRRAGLQKQA
jgi:large subunit ribosomal protein L15